MKTLIKLCIAIIMIFFAGMFYAKHIHHILVYVFVSLGCIILANITE
jgi:hypothetical protein